MINLFIRVRQSLKAFRENIRFVDFSTETMNKYLSHISETMYNDKIVKVLSMLKEFFEYEPMLQHSRKAVRLEQKSTYVCNLLKDALRGLSAPAAWQTPEKFFI